MKNLWKYIETRHQDYGIALFVVPVLALAFIAVSVCCAVVALFAG